LVLSEEIATGTSHRIYVDVHGKLCRLLEEAQAVAGITGGFLSFIFFSIRSS